MSLYVVAWRVPYEGTHAVIVRAESAKHAPGIADPTGFWLDGGHEYTVNKLPDSSGDAGIVWSPYTV